MAEVQLREVVKRYGKMTAVHGISLDIEDKQFVALVGPSGCGKTTTLRMVAGLESISEGDLLIGGKRVNNVAPKNRDIAMVFQNYALYPHMSVYKNIAFGLQMRKMSKAEIDTTVRDAARILEIEHLLDRRPGQLSGGQRQRVAMGRAIVRHPQVFLFDEPLSNLDAKLRVQMRAEIKRVHQKVDTTILYVTHDQVEAMTMADSIVVMNQGRIEQHGTPHELYHHPRTRFVAGFIGSPTMNFLPARLEMSGESLEIVLSDGIRASVPEARRERYAPYVGKDLLLGVRPEHFYGQRPATSSATLDLRITPDIVEVMGMESIIYFQFAGRVVCAKLESGPGIASGTPAEVHADLDHMHIIDPETDLVV